MMIHCTKEKIKMPCVRCPYVPALGIILVTAMGHTAEAQGTPAAALAQTAVGQQPVAEQLVNKAMQAAKKSNKPVLVYVIYTRSPTSPDDSLLAVGQRQMKERRDKVDALLRSAEVATHYEVVRLVAPTFGPGNPNVEEGLTIIPKVDVVLQRLSPKGGTIIVLDTAGSKIAEWTDGWLENVTPSALDELLAKTAPRLSAADRKRLVDVLPPLPKH